MSSIDLPKLTKSIRLLTLSPGTMIQDTITIKLVDWRFYPRPQPALNAIADCLMLLLSIVVYLVHNSSGKCGELVYLD